MADMLLDVTVFQDYFRGDAGAGAIVNEIVGGTKTATVSPLTVQRLWSNPELDRKTEIGMLGLLNFMEQAPVSLTIARTSGLWLAADNADEDGTLAYVTIIAATALERSEPICTRNTEPFMLYYPNVFSY